MNNFQKGYLTAFQNIEKMVDKELSQPADPLIMPRADDYNTVQAILRNCINDRLRKHFTETLNEWINE